MDDRELIRRGIRLSAKSLGIDPVVLATTISYETAGTFNPRKKGPTTRYGQHEGLIQFGKPQARQYGVDWKNAIKSQLGPNGAVVKYLKAAGVKPGMGLKDVYSAINAGRVGRYNASDEAAGGAPGTVADKVAGMDDHHANAVRFMGGAGSGKGNFKQTVDDAVDDASVDYNAPFPPAPRNYSDRPRTTGPVANSDRDVASRDTRKQNMDPNGLIQRLLAAGGRQSTNVEDQRVPPQMAPQQGPNISDSPEWQKAVETFMVHYNREPATDSDMEMVANLMKGNDLTNEDVQDNVLKQMGETDDEQSEAGPDNEQVEGEGKDLPYYDDEDPGEAAYQKCVDEWVQANGRQPESDKDFAEIEQLMSEKYDQPQTTAPVVDPRQQILKQMGVR